MAIVPDQRKPASPPEPTSAYNGPVSVGRFVAPIAGKTLSRGGTVLAELVSEWPVIAGASLSAFTVPAKLTKSAPDPDAVAGKPTPSVLHLKVDPAKALDVQYSTPQLIERINQTLGFRAVSALRLIQAPIARKATASKRPPLARGAAVPAKEKTHTEAAPAAPENRLAAALARMGRGIKARGCSG